MEDKADCKDGLDNDSTAGVWGVYDGHLGNGIATILQDNLIENIDEGLEEYDQDDMEKFFGTAFMATERQINRSTYPEVGSCCSIAMIREEDDKKVVYSANVGDSKIVMVQGETATQLSYDHKADDTEEADRIEDFGGELFSMGGPERVGGVLAVTRAFGDFNLKLQGVFCIPTVKRVEIDENSDEDTFIIVASDGLWDVIGLDRCAEIVNEADDTQDAVDNLVKEAIDEGTRDNTSCWVIKV